MLTPFWPPSPGEVAIYGWHRLGGPADPAALHRPHRHLRGLQPRRAAGGSRGRGSTGTRSRSPRCSPIRCCTPSSATRAWCRSPASAIGLSLRSSAGGSRSAVFMERRASGRHGAGRAQRQSAPHSGKSSRPRLWSDDASTSCEIPSLVACRAGRGTRPYVPARRRRSIGAVTHRSLSERFDGGDDLGLEGVGVESGRGGRAGRVGPDRWHPPAAPALE